MVEESFHGWINTVSAGQKGFESKKYGKSDIWLVDTRFNQISTGQIPHFI